ncbi:MAG: hypothetical protein JRN22_02195 [Nitrososphaerota archaeon]|nr:hypothetical protein [Nitrososphaerota archaeon]
MTRTIIGMQRQGKTELTKLFIRRRSKPCLIINPLDEKYPGIHMAEYDYEKVHLETLRMILRAGFPISTPINMVTGNPEHFHAACEIVKRHKEIMLVADEIDMFDSPNRTDPTFMKLIQYGDGHYQSDIITTSRRPKNISVHLRSQTQEWYIFRLQEPADIDYLGKIHKDFPGMIEKLGMYHYIYYDTFNPPEIREPILI